MPAKRGLGRGLGALIKDGTPAPGPAPADSSGVRSVAIDQVSRNQWQPRREFDREALEDLTSSVRERGVLQPLLVRETADGFELIAGERRLRAAADAGLAEVPVIVLKADDEESLEIALVENLQRQDLGPLEEAEGYRTLIDKFGLTQDQVAQRVGKARASVANALRLLTLPDEVQDGLRAGDLSPGHAKVLLGVDIAQEQLALARRVVAEALSVRNLEKLVERARRAPRKPRAARGDIPHEHLTYLAEKLHTHFGTSVRISPTRTFANGKKGKGTLEIDFFSNDDLDRLLSLFGISED